MAYKLEGQGIATKVLVAKAHDENANEHKHSTTESSLIHLALRGALPLQRRTAARLRSVKCFLQFTERETILLVELEVEGLAHEGNLVRTDRRPEG